MHIYIYLLCITSIQMWMYPPSTMYIRRTRLFFFSTFRRLCLLPFVVSLELTFSCGAPALSLFPRIWIDFMH